MSRDIAIHVALALLVAAVASAIMYGIRAAGIDPIWLGGAMVGTAVFLSREIAQAAYKDSGKIYWAEAYWPAAACVAAAIVATIIIRGAE